ALRHLIEKATDEQESKTLKQTLAALEAGAEPGGQKDRSAPSAPARDVTGAWTGSMTGPNGDEHDLTFSLRSDGNRLTGTVTGAPPQGSERIIAGGKVEGDQVSFETSAEGHEGSPVKFTCTAK